MDFVYIVCLRGIILRTASSMISERSPAKISFSTDANIFYLERYSLASAISFGISMPFASKVRHMVSMRFF